MSHRRAATALLTALAALLPLIVAVAPASAAPSAPLNLRAHPAYDGVGLTWNVAGDIPTAQRVYRHVGDAVEPIAELPAGQRWYVDKQPIGSTHTYSVSLLYGTEEGPRSATVTATVSGSTATGGSITALTRDIVGQDWWEHRHEVVVEPPSDIRASVPADRSRFTIHGKSPEEGASGVRLVLSPPLGQPWTTGVFPVATWESASNVGVNGLCWIKSGSITIHEAQVPALGAPEVFAATLRVECFGVPAGPKHAEIRWNAATPLVAGLPAPRSLNAGELPAGQTSPPYEVTITSLGTAELTLGEATFSGPAASDWSIASNSCVGASLAPAEACSLSVRVTPTKWGRRGAHLRVADNTASGSRVVDVWVSGITPPSEVYNLTSGVGVGRADLAWTHAFDGGRPITSYRVYLGDNEATPALVQDGPSTNYRATGLQVGRRYYYRITAVNEVGEGPGTTSSFVVPTHEVVFSSRNSKGVYDLVAVGHPAQGPTIVAADGSNHHHPAVSPDGRWIAFVSKRGGSAYNRLWVRRADGTGTPKRLTAAAANDAQPAWSANGRRLAFARRAPGGLSHIYLVSAAGGAATRVPNSARATTPSWLPNGKALVVTSRNSRGVARLDILATDGSVRRAIAGTSHGVGGDVSPDGTRILFTQDFYGVPNTSRVCVCGGTPSVVVPNDGPAHDDVTWSPSGRSFYFSDGGQTINHYTASGRVIARVAGDGSKEIHPTVRDVAVRRPVPGVGMPVRGADFTGDGRADLAVFRPANGRWFVKGQPSVAYGKVGDVPVAANYVGNRRAEIAVFRPSTGAWHIRGRAPLTYGQAGDIPVPADYNGDGRAEIAVFRPSTGAWHIRGRAPLTYGQAGDIPVPADYNGDGRAETAVYRPGTGTWYVPGRAAIVFGTRSDLPAPADYNGDGRADLARYRPSNGRFEVRGRAATSTPMRVLGAPVSGNFTGDRKAEAMVFDGWRWYNTSTRTSTAFGGFGDLPV